METRMIGMCGAYCGTCEWKDRTNCPGCQTCGSKMFWGECKVAKCCIGKGLLHCGLCSQVPCEMLKGYFTDPEHGDDGERLANLKAWAKGETTIINMGTFKKAKAD